MEFQTVTRTGCHGGRRHFRIGSGGSFNILPNKYSSNEELELEGFERGLQGHGLVQRSSKHRAHGDTALHNRSGNRMLVEQGCPCCKLWYLSPDFSTRKWSLKSSTGSQVSTQLPIQLRGNFSKKRGRRASFLSLFKQTAWYLNPPGRQNIHQTPNEQNYWSLLPPSQTRGQRTGREKFTQHQKTGLRDISAANSVSKKSHWMIFKAD